MRHAYTMKEKVERLNGLLPETVYEMTEEIKDGKVETDKVAGRVTIRFDFRKALKKKMDKEGVTQYSVAKRLGMSRSNFNRFIKGHIPIPFSKIEELMWLMMEDNMIIDNNDEQITDLRSRGRRKS